MKCLLIWALLATSSAGPFGSAYAQLSTTGEAKYWIFFADEPAADRVQRAEISMEARERRARRGSAFPATADYHVSAGHLDALRDLGIDLVVESRWLNAVSAYLSDQEYLTVSDLPFVSRLRPVGRATEADAGMELPSLPIVEAVGPMALEYGPSELQLALVNALPNLDIGINGEGVRLGFLDASFADLSHASLQHLHMEERARIESFTDPQGGSHGLSVVSVAAGYAPGELIGPAYGAHILGATTEYVPSETNAEEDYFVAGLEWLEAMGADVVNASIGYTTFDPGQQDYTPEDLDGNTGVTTRAADLAVALGITFVGAAGNEGCTSPEFCWYYINTPADGDSVIAVGGVTRDSVRSSFSSRGPTADDRIKPDVAALASSVYIALPGGGFGYSGGTSFAAPMVAGIVAQILQVNPALEPLEIASILKQTASQAENPDNDIGWGIVNAAAAVQVAVELGGEELQSPEALKAVTYPNPATDYLFIDIKSPSPYVPAVTMYDVLGRKLGPSEIQIRSASRDLISITTSRLPPGVYFFTVESESGRTGGTFVVAR